MTCDTCMSIADTLAPNRVPEQIKRRWLCELEGRILVELEGVSPETLTPPEETQPATLSVPYPYDRMYWMYILAMLDYVSGDGARYENSAALFNSAYQSYAKFRLNNPRKG